MKRARDVNFGSRFVRSRPEQLPAFANEAWPDLHSWPTAGGLLRFRAITRKDPETRLAVLNGLRHYAESSSNMMLGLAAFLVSLAAVLVVMIPTSSQWYWSVLGPVASLLVLTMGLYVPAAIALETRRKSAVTWLRAIEDHSKLSR